MLARPYVGQFVVMVSKQDHTGRLNQVEGRPIIETLRKVQKLTWAIELGRLGKVDQPSKGHRGQTGNSSSNRKPLTGFRQHCYDLGMAVKSQDSDLGAVLGKSSKLECVMRAQITWQDCRGSMYVAAWEQYFMLSVSTFLSTIITLFSFLTAFLMR